MHNKLLASNDVSITEEGNTTQVPEAERDAQNLLSMVREPVPSPEMALGMCLGLTLLPLGFLLPHGCQWYYLSSLSTGGQFRENVNTFADPTLKYHAYWYWTSFVLFWVFRQSMLPWYIDCPNNISMDVSCLFTVQTGAYQFFYVMHIILLCFLIFHWMADIIVVGPLALALLECRNSNVNGVGGSIGEGDGINSSVVVEEGIGARLRKNHLWMFVAVTVLTAIFCSIYVAVNW